MPQSLLLLPETPSQTAGPYVHIGCVPNHAGISGIYADDPGQSPFAKDAAGKRITVTGSVFDGTGAALNDVMLESWQADGDGIYAPYQGWARMVADAHTGQWQLDTIKPGPVGPQAPHIALWIVARGINLGLLTRVYFEGDDQLTDPLLSRIDPVRRVNTLIAQETDPGCYRFDIHLQGDQETVFLDI
ncbi:protocatechuate 3,4-dioxygenase subunit alpha [Parasulfitobacter algicola]|uniref:Protocatechuate 3,4-dioxygenase subunit alpha n=1 Tax=Parasulfitobacter algicola TaxID=2614809 RepID=A0ABX2ITF7_9RHOB|nr:protocatechuate 3,4-dioxygenase subunit alpha [Sulfitobacter algicola]NSX56176.1 protocatechuate 3,4-dioxygenase subunit alpha [Sulfitobacter algicola]